MMHAQKILKNEKGSVIIFALMILVLLTLIGISATKTTNVELQIAGNETAYKKALYNADAGISYALVSLDESSISSLSSGASLPVQSGQPFDLTYLGVLNPGESPVKIEVQSDSAGGSRDGDVSVVAGIQLPTPQTGAVATQGEEGEY